MFNCLGVWLFGWVLAGLVCLAVCFRFYAALWGVCFGGTITCGLWVCVFVVVLLFTCLWV